MLNLISFQYTLFKELIKEACAPRPYKKLFKFQLKILSCLSLIQINIANPPRL